MAKIHHAGEWVNSGVRTATTDVYNQARDLIHEMIQNPEISSQDKAKLKSQLSQLHEEFRDVENEKIGKGSSNRKTKRNGANLAFRNTEIKLQSIADEVMVSFAHLLGNEDDVTPRAAVSAGGAGSKSPSASGADDAAELMSGPESLALFRKSPEEFSSYYRALSPEDRQLATMSLQEEMQSQNQLFSLLSNMQQADHQTGRSIVSNIRV